MDGYNNTWDPTSESSFEITTGWVNSTVLGYLDATGMSFVRGVKWMNTSDDRGLAYLFFDSSNNAYYAVFQYNDQIYGIPGLARFVSGNSTYYYNGQEAVFFYDGDDAATAVKGIRYGDIGGSNAGFRLYKYGNSTFYTSVHTGVVWDQDSTTDQGHALVNHFGIGAPANRQFRSGNASLTNTQYDWYGGTWVNHDTTDFENMLIDYFSCALTSGNVSFYAYQGNEYCGITGNSPAVDCVIDGDTYTITESNFSDVSYNDTTPTFKNTQPLTDGVLVSPTYSIESNPFAWQFIHRQEHDSMLTVIPQDQNGQLRNTSAAYVISYESPTGQVDDLNISLIDIDTFLVTAALKCEEGFLANDHYYLEYLAGKNETHYQFVNLTCANGVITTHTQTDITDYTTVLDSAQEVQIENLEFLDADADEPIWFDYSDNALNRLFVFNLEFFGDTGSMYEGDIIVGDNENYVLNYTASIVNVNSVTTNAYNFGTYFYSCTVPDGYVALSNASGYVTINQPMEHVDVIYQEESFLNMNVSLLFGNSPASHAFCRSNVSGAQQAGVDGVCSFGDLNAFEVVNVVASYGRESRSALFQIGDYYGINADGEPVSELNNLCESFAGTYEFEWSIDQPYATMDFIVKSKSNPDILISNATIYWDGVAIGSTNNDGRYTAQVDWEFINHNLTVMHDTYNSFTTDATLHDSPVTILMTCAAGNDCDTEYTAHQSGTTEGDYSGLYSTLLSPYALALIAVAASVAVGTVITASAAVGGLFGFIATVGLILFGVLPEWIGILLAILCAVMVGILVLMFTGD